MESVDNTSTVSKSELIEMLGCSHKWERKQGRYGIFYLCARCDMELSVDQYNCVQQAYRTGVNAANMLPHRAMFDSGYAKGYAAARLTAISIVEEYRCDACEDTFDNIITDISRMEP